MGDKQLTGPKVVTLAYDDLCTFEFAIATEIFGLRRPEMGTTWYRHAVAANSQSVSIHGGLQLQVDAGLTPLAEADIVVIPGWRKQPIPPASALGRALRRAHERGARLVSICSGAFALACTGLLDDREATTHWRYTDELQQQFPKVRVLRDVLYVANDNIVTSAGSAAGIDACLFVVEQDFGTAAAQMVAERLVVPLRRGPEHKQQVRRPASTFRAGSDLGRLMEWMLENLDQSLLPEQLAERVAMSKSSLARHFKAATGMTVKRWLTEARIEHAKVLLANPRQSVEETGRLCGFESLPSFRRQFRARTGVSPSEFRANFGLGRCYQSSIRERNSTD